MCSKIAIVVDDILDDVNHMINAAKVGKISVLKLSNSIYLRILLFLSTYHPSLLYGNNDFRTG